MPVDKKINYLEFPALDFNAIQKFYESVFNWTFVSYGDEYMSFNDGFIEGGFYKSDQHSFTASGAALIVIYSADLEQLQQAIKDNGGTIKKQIFPFPGGRRFHFSDPAGNELAAWSDME